MAEATKEAPEEVQDESTLDDALTQANETVEPEQTAPEQPEPSGESQEQPEEPQAEQPSESEKPSFNVQGFKDFAREQFGYDLSKYQSDEEAAKGLIEASRKVGERDEYAKRYKELEPYLSEFNEFLQNRGQQTQPTQQQQEETAREIRAAYDPQWEGWMERDESTGAVKQDQAGNVKWQVGTPKEVKDGFHQWYDASQRFRRDPVSFIKEQAKSLLDVDQITEQVRERVFGELQQRHAQESQVHQAQRILQENSGWMYQTNGQGQPVMDPETGRPVFSERGAAYFNAVQRLTQSGLNDQATIDHFAKQEVAAQFGKPDAVFDKPKPDIKPGGKRADNKSGSSSRTPETFSLEQELLRDMRELNQ